MPLLKVNQLSKTFHHKQGKIEAVQSVSFEIEQGSTLALIGESGSGKSTIARLLMGVIPKDSGEFIFEGKNVFELSKQERFNFCTELQMIFQDPFSSLNPFMTVEQILKEPFLIHKRASKKQLDKEIDQLLDYVALPKTVKKRYPHEFSGGQRQRIGIARALSLKPKCIICDEPISSLDVSIGAQILNLLIRLQNELNLTYLFIAHDLNMVKYVADTICVMFKGQMVESGKVNEVFLDPKHPYTKALFNASFVADPRKQREKLKGFNLDLLDQIQQKSMQNQ